MGKHKEEINPIREWISNDNKLSGILIDIEGKSDSLEEQAELAFHRVSEEYHLPKMPQDIDYEKEYEEEPTSVYQNLGLLKYTYPDGDPRSNVMVAIYCSKEYVEPNMEDFWQKVEQDGFSKNDILGVGYLGDNYNVKIKLVMKGETWSDYGFNLFTKYV